MKRTRGFTLVEMVLNLTVVTLLMGILSSAILVAGRALPDPKSPQQASSKAYEAAEQIAAELYGAVSFIDRTNRSVEFTVADRNADNTSESIRYEWSGTPGDPLTRKYNGGAQTPVVSNIHQFMLTYRTEVGQRQSPSTPSESAEMLLAAQDSGISQQNQNINDNNWIGQYFAPTLPHGATEWRVTRVRVKAKTHGTADGVIAVQLRTSSGNVPSATVLEQTLMYESNLLFIHEWKNFPFNNVSGLAPGTALCLVLAKQSGGSDAADILYEGNGSNRVKTSNAGASWSNEASKSMVYQIYGKYTSMSTPPPTTITFITLVGISLQIGSDSTSRVETTVQILNRPEVPLMQIVELNESQL